MRAIASFKASAAVDAKQEGPDEAADISRTVLSNLVGNEARGGALQVTLAGVGTGGSELLTLLCGSL